MAQVTETHPHAPRQPAAGAGVHVQVDRVDSAEERHSELLAGLMQPEAHIAPKFFYDEQGSALYGAICALEEYYPPRLEASIFQHHRAEIARALPHGGQWVDLGCGDGRKAWPWIEALALRRYIGVDIAEPWLRASLQVAAREFPRVQFEGVVTDFTRGLSLRHVLQRAPGLPSVFFYPGSSIGNFEPVQALALLRAIREHLGPDDRLLIGVDGLKPHAPLVAAYDDALGVTAAFNLNVLRVVNRELGADFALTGFRHRALFNARHGRIEMHLVSHKAQAVHLGAHERRFEPGEAIVTEHSYKYAAEGFAERLVEAGFAKPLHWSDERQWFHVFVAAPAAYRQ